MSPLAPTGVSRTPSMWSAALLCLSQHCHFGFSFLLCKLRCEMYFSFDTNYCHPFWHVKIVLEIFAFANYLLLEKVIGVALRFYAFVILLNTQWETWQCLWNAYLNYSCPLQMFILTLFTVSEDWTTFLCNFFWWSWRLNSGPCTC
jgi:hypothetical protein